MAPGSCGAGAARILAAAELARFLFASPQREPQSAPESGRTPRALPRRAVFCRAGPKHRLAPLAAVKPVHGRADAASPSAAPEAAAVFAHHFAACGKAASCEHSAAASPYPEIGAVCGPGADALFILFGVFCRAVRRGAGRPFSNAPRAGVMPTPARASRLTRRRGCRAADRRGLTRLASPCASSVPAGRRRPLSQFIASSPRSSGLYRLCRPTPNERVSGSCRGSPCASVTLL